MRLEFPGPALPARCRRERRHRLPSPRTDPAGTLQAAVRRYPSDAPPPHCELSRFIPLPASARWARGLTPGRSCPRALDGAWLMASVLSPIFSLSCLLRPQSEPQPEPALFTSATGSWGGEVGGTRAAEGLGLAGLALRAPSPNRGLVS